ncbi:MAG: riboflavin synthase [Brevinemataceae bacterium]
MFTGIIEEIGTVERIASGSSSSKLFIHAPTILQDTKLGDSIAVNGICLTVSHIVNKLFEADVMPETMRVTNFKELKTNSLVNLERALTIHSRLGGHIVSGHIDGTGIISSIDREANAHWITIKASPEILKYIIPRGSITVDGVSLTAAVVASDSFKVSIIPHTAKETVLLKKTIGNMVNLENDIFAKYTAKLLSLNTNSENITEEFLKNNGFY